MGLQSRKTEYLGKREKDNTERGRGVRRQAWRRKWDVHLRSICSLLSLCSFSPCVFHADASVFYNWKLCQAERVMRVDVVGTCL